MEKLTLQNLEGVLWSCADILRGELSAAEYKDYIFGLLFLKRLNDEFDEQGMLAGEVEILLNDSIIYELQ
ncbi:type I restriction-modification system subunit M N-terminal domain-containing protein [Clostridium sp.]|jgi:type I restriction enzyme M protein|uniref:type I restriction-modification system subunit M N-terminal domain-containing protein n=1 Tax=Clostridium sp. TaxID=1506 RepID=UPI003EE9D463